MILNDVLDITRIQWMPKRNDETEGLGSGQILQAGMATPLWTAQVVTPITEFQTGRRIRAILNSLTGPGKTFEIYDPIAKYPASDPTGTVLAASTVLVNNVSAGQISLKGLPVGFALKYGDYFQVTWGTSPVRTALFEMSQDITANGSGVTALFNTFPFPLQGIAADDPVTLLVPKLKAIFVPGSIDYPTADSDTWKFSGITFQVMQKLS